MISIDVDIDVSGKTKSVVEKVRVASSTSNPDFQRVILSAAKQAATAMREEDPCTALLQYALGFAQSIIEAISSDKLGELIKQEPPQLAKP